jgi:hypothetical protein
MAWAVDQTTLGNKCVREEGKATIAFKTTAAVASGAWVIVAVEWFGETTLSKVEGGGLTWEIVKAANKSNNRSAIVKAYAPAGLAKETEITATLSGNTTSRGIMGASFKGGGEGATTHATAESSGETKEHSSSPTGSTGDLCIEACRLNNKSSSNTPESGTTESADVAVSASPATYSLSFKITGEASGKVGGTWGAANTWVNAGATFTPAAEGKTVEGKATIAGTGAIEPKGARTATGKTSVPATGSITAAGTPTHLGKATIGSTGSLSPKGTKVFEGKASVTGTGSVSPKGLHTGIGKGLISGSGTLVPRAIATYLDKASILGTGAITPAGVAEHPAGKTVEGKATVTGSSSFTTEALRIGTGKASILGTGALAPKATRTTSGKATVLGTGAISTNGGRVWIGQATISGLGTLEAIGAIGDTEAEATLTESAIKVTLRDRAITTVDLFDSATQTHLSDHSL